MSARHSRGRGRSRNTLARPAVAFIGSADAHALDENPNAAKRGARWRETFGARRAALVVANAQLPNAGDPERGVADLSVTFRGVARNGRRDPRVGETRYGRV